MILNTVFSLMTCVFKYVLRMYSNNNYGNKLPAADGRTGDDGNELLDVFLFNAGLVLIGFTTVCNNNIIIINIITNM